MVNQTSLYYEPHGSHDPALKQFAPVDVMITPIADLKLPLGIPLIQGNTALTAVEWLQPKFLLPSAAPGDVSYTGWLVNFLTTQGSAAQVQQELATKGLRTKIIEPQPGERLELLAKSSY